MRKSEQKQLGELLFTVTQMPATRASRISQQLMRTVLPALAKAATGLQGVDASKGLADLDLGKLLANVGDGLDLFFEKMSADEFEKLWRELFEVVQVTANGRTAPLLPVFDDIMVGQMLNFYKLVAFALEVNFQDFFVALASQSSSLTTAASALLSKTSATLEKNGSAGAS